MPDRKTYVPFDKPPAQSRPAPPAPPSSPGDAASVPPGLVEKTLPLDTKAPVDPGAPAVSPARHSFPGVERVSTPGGQLVPVLSAVAVPPAMLDGRPSAIPVPPPSLAPVPPPPSLIPLEPKPEAQAAPLPTSDDAAATPNVPDAAKVQDLLRQADEALARADAREEQQLAAAIPTSQPALTDAEVAEIREVGTQLQAAYARFIRAAEALGDLASRLPG